MPRVYAAISIACLVGGCSRAHSDALIAARTSLDAAQAALAAENLSEAIPLLTAAIESGVLPPEDEASALVDRAVALARFDMFDLAHTDLDTAAGAAPPQRVHVARSYVYAREGKASEAEAEFAKARQLDPSAEQISD